MLYSVLFIHKLKPHVVPQSSILVSFLFYIIVGKDLQNIAACQADNTKLLCCVNAVPKKRDAGVHVVNTVKVKVSMKGTNWLCVIIFNNTATKPGGARNWTRCIKIGCFH